MKEKIEPFLKWAGGKRWLLSGNRKLFPKTYNRYIEPFLGSGAVYFSLLPACAILSDSNEELINAFQVIKNVPNELQRILKRYQKLHSIDFYHSMRSKHPISSVGRAARFIYLNRTCFNGIYRVNSEGVFNVPMGTKNKIEFEEGYLETARIALSPARLIVSDFENIIAKAKKGDFVYIDPPYTVMHNSNNFIKYNSTLFSWDDQIRLRNSATNASDRGALVMVSNADHQTIKELYKGFGTQHQVFRNSKLAAKAIHRIKTSELVFTNYENI